MIKVSYDPAELLALQELDEVMKALKLSDEDVIELLLDNSTINQQRLIQHWYSDYEVDCAFSEAEESHHI